MQKLVYQTRNSSIFDCTAKFMVSFAFYIENNIHKQKTTDFTQQFKAFLKPKITSTQRMIAFI